ncbi:sulfotransferase domain-containing protein [Salegentibacter maritimus]|uniref:sulfotransferase domain-containing protein n=1 Tax=Salegentibacter maritimus TaxID=2794347 RepID=UPI0018E42704|nr:sulfotransferase domain-containing protein [Salegentibacter maritimus]MBI6117348.1 sulfotransferase domain-containing protein [Salegentibacter maritimus]
MNKVAIFSVPRSGSSWLGQIFNSQPKVVFRFQPNFAYSFNHSLSERDSKTDIEEFYKNLSITKDAFVKGELTISSRKGIFFKKKVPDTLVFKETHFLNVIPNLLVNSDSKVIGLIRSPFSVINSWINIPKEFDPNWSVASEWKMAEKKNKNINENYFGYNKWKEAAFLFLKLKEEYPDRFYLVDYNALLTDKVVEVEKLFNFCGLEMTAQTKEFLNKSSEKNDKDAYSVFKQKSRDDKWQDELPEFIIDEIKADKDFQELNKIFKWI